jgi:hypothetical protein
LAVGSWQTEYFRTAFDLNNPKIQVTSCKSQYRAFDQNLWYLFELPALAKAIAADVVHLSFPAPLFRHRMPCRGVATINDLYPYDEPENSAASKLMFNRWLLGMCLRNSDALACVSALLGTVPMHLYCSGRFSSLAAHAKELCRLGRHPKCSPTCALNLLLRSEQ